MTTPLFRHCPLCLFLAVIGLMWNPAIGGAEGAGEYQVKSAFIYHFANFVDWPASTFNATNGHLRICVMGKDPFGPTLAETLSNKTVEEHPLEVHRNPPFATLHHCHMLYVASSSQLHHFLKQVEKENVLTVGENLDFMKQGGMVQFFMDNQKVRFSVNTHAVNQTKLKVSSKLLRLAKMYTP